MSWGKPILALICISTYACSTNQAFESAYSNIGIENDCKNIEKYEHHMGGGVDCGSYANISIEVFSDDLRDTVDLIRNNTRYKLDFYTTITSHLSLLGKKIEWRYPKGQAKHPTAMIVRLNIDIEGLTQKDNRTDSYLIVSKITNDTICVVEKVAPQIGQNTLARKLADKATSLPCLIDREINKRIQ